MVKWWRGKRIDGPDYDRARYGAASAWPSRLAPPNRGGSISRVRARLSGWWLAVVRYTWLFTRITLVVMALDWVSKLAINLRIEAIPNDARLTPVLTPAVFENQWFPLNEAGTLAITHVEHAFESAADHVVAVGTELLGVVLAVLLASLILRVRAWVVVVSLAMRLGGAVGNLGELLLLGNVTDWLWVSPELLGWLVEPGQSVALNFADAAIYIGVSLFSLAALYRFLVILVWVIRKVYSSRPGRITGSEFR